ncbi:MAG: transketolase [Anaerolineaceae bacterium]|nr:transketolase [Anaerolineaceae bacterium]
MVENQILKILDRNNDPVKISSFEVNYLAYRCEKARKTFIDTLYRYGRGHPGPSLSLVEILMTLYIKELRIDPKNPKWEDRDRFILSKGHGSLGFYTVLAETGLISHDELATFESLGSRLQGHVDSIWLPWVELTTGSLGQGLSVALGVAIGAKKLGKDIRSYCVIGDGESEEGNIWEAAMAASKFEADNLLCITDFNGLQGGVTLEVMPSLEPIVDKWKAFGWHVIDIPGHDIGKLLGAYSEARQTKGKPSIIIARTVKGKGVSYMENKPEWHGGTVTKQLYDQAMSEINGRLTELHQYADFS